MLLCGTKNLFFWPAVLSLVSVHPLDCSNDMVLCGSLYSATQYSISRLTFCSQHQAIMNGAINSVSNGWDKALSALDNKGQ